MAERVQLWNFEDLDDFSRYITSVVDVFSSVQRSDIDNSPFASELRAAYAAHPSLEADLIAIERHFRETCVSYLHVIADRLRVVSRRLEGPDPILSGIASDYRDVIEGSSRLCYLLEPNLPFERRLARYMTEVLHDHWHHEAIGMPTACPFDIGKLATTLGLSTRHIKNDPGRPLHRVGNEARPGSEQTHVLLEELLNTTEIDASRAGRTLYRAPSGSVHYLPSEVTVIRTLQMTLRGHLSAPPQELTKAVRLFEQMMLDALDKFLYVTEATADYLGAYSPQLGAARAQAHGLLEHTLRSGRLQAISEDLVQQGASPLPANTELRELSLSQSQAFSRARDKCAPVDLDRLLDAELDAVCQDLGSVDLSHPCVLDSQTFLMIIIPFTQRGKAQLTLCLAQNRSAVPTETHQYAWATKQLRISTPAGETRSIRLDQNGAAHLNDLSADQVQFARWGSRPPARIIELVNSFLADTPPM